MFDRVYELGRVMAEEILEGSTTNTDQGLLGFRLSEERKDGLPASCRVFVDQSMPLYPSPERALRYKPAVKELVALGT